MRWLLLFFLLLTPALAGAEIRYQGEQTLWQDTIWQGEVVIDGILTVAPQARLKIRPGTVVRFTFADSNGDGYGENELFVQGVIDARGTPELPIRFTSAASDPRPGSWGALNMMASQEANLLRHCIVEYAYRGFHAHFGRARISDCQFRHNLRALQFQESKVTIARCRIENNFNGLQFRDSQVQLEESTIAGNHWGVRAVYSEINMRACRLENNDINGLSLRDSQLIARANLVQSNRKGIYLQRSRGELRENLFLDNAEHGIFLEDSQVDLLGNRVAGNGRAGIRWLDSQGRMEQNSLENNAEYALINDGSEALSPGLNWWGNLLPHQVATVIRDADDRPAVGRVNLEQILIEPPPLPLFAQQKVPDWP